MNFKQFNGNIQPVPLFRILILIFFTVPLIEIYILLRMSSLFGLVNTLALCVLTALIGAGLLRHQGISTLRSVQEKLSVGQLPALEVISGMLLLLAGALLLTPGFFTDTIGFMTLVPALRRRLAGLLLNCLHPVAAQEDSENRVIIEGEYRVEEHERLRR